MNISTFFGLNVGMSALNAMQQAENVVSNNIANSNTPGYVAESATLGELPPFPPLPANDAPLLHGQLGQGVQLQAVQRQTSAFVNQQDRANQGTYQMYSTHHTGLSQIESILNEPSSNSLQNTVDQFFSAWQTLSTDPSNTAARQAVISQAQSVGQVFQTVTTQLEALQANLNGPNGVVAGQINELNQYAAQVAALNGQIAGVQQAGQSPNTLLDQRGLLLDQMAALANITYSQNAQGEVNVSVGSVTLVTAGSSTSGSMADTPSNLAQVTSGGIAGNVASANDTGNVLSSLNSFLNAFATQVNSIQTSGYQLNSATNGPPIFAAAPDAAGNTILSVPSGFAPANVAAATQPNQPGDNTNALNMVALQSSTGYNGGTFDQGIAQIVSSVGTEAASVISSESTANALAQQSSSLRQSISGVNINGEAARMVQYQNTYSAAAKFIGVFDSMMQTLINSVP